MALVKVRSNIPDDDLTAYVFDFGYMSHKVNRHGDELWVYVQRNAKRVTITRQGYTAPGEYQLPVAVEGGKTYRLQLSAQLPTVHQQMVQFVLSPALKDAVVTVTPARQGGQEETFGVTDAEGKTARSLPLGSYNYRVAAADYKVSTGHFTLSDRTATHDERVALRPNFAEVTLSVDAEADIYVDGQRKGRRTWTGRLAPGLHSVECRQQNHRSSEQVVKVAEGHNETFSLTPPVAITGTLAVTSSPSGAAIRIDGRDYGLTPRNIPDIVIGRHTVNLTRQNYQTAEKTVEVKENETTPVSLTLSDIATMTINSKPSGAALYINGESKGRTPYTAEMASGDYDLWLMHPRYKDFRKRIHLDSSQPEATFEMKKTLQNPSAIVLQAGYQISTFGGIALGIDAYINNYCGGIFFLKGLSYTENVYWYNTSNDEPEPGNYDVMLIGVNFGYAFLKGKKLRITPQISVSGLRFVGEGRSTRQRFYAVSPSLCIKVNYAFTRSIGTFLKVGYGSTIFETKTYKLLKDISRDIETCGSGFTLRIGIGYSININKKN